MTTHEAILDDDVILAEEAPQQVRVAEGIGPQGEWVAWAGGNRKTVRIIAVDDDAFYAKAVPFDKAVALMKELRDGNPPSVALAKGRTIPIDKIRDLRIEEKSGQVTIVFPYLTKKQRWSHAKFNPAVQHDLLEQVGRRLPDAARWREAYTRRKAAVMPCFCLLIFGFMTTMLVLGLTGEQDQSPNRSLPDEPSLDGLVRIIGPIGVLVLAGAFLIGSVVYLVSAVRNPPVYAGIKPKISFFSGKSKKQSTT